MPKLRYFIYLCLLALGSATAAAQSVVTFQYDTLLDTTAVGGGPGTPLRATFSFARDLPPGSGGIGTTPNAASYGPASLTLQVGSESVTVSGPANLVFIGVFNDAGTSIVEDSYSLQAFEPASFSGPLFGFQVESFDLHLLDSDLDMFSDTTLPTTPAFAARADQSYVFLELRNSEGFPIFLANFGEGAPFSLIAPPTGCDSAQRDLPGLRAEVNALDTSAGARAALGRILDAVETAEDEGRTHEARIKLGLFIQSVIIRSALSAPRPERLLVPEANHLVCSSANVLTNLIP